MNTTKPWGSDKIIQTGCGYQVKQLTISPRQKISLQSHKHRSEHWLLVKGTAVIVINGVKRIINAGEYIFIQKGDVHRISNESTKQAIIIEIQMGEIIDDNDIIRIEDIYGRI